MVLTHRFTHDQAGNTISHAAVVDGVQGKSRIYSVAERDELLADSGGAAAPYVALAGWTDAAVAAAIAEAQRLLGAVHSFTHDQSTNTIEHTLVEGGVPKGSRNYSATQRDELLANSGNAAAPYCAIAGWTDEYVVALLAEEQRLAAEAAAKVAAAAAAEREAEVQRQMAIIAEAQARLAAGV